MSDFGGYIGLYFPNFLCISIKKLENFIKLAFSDGVLYFLVPEELGLVFCNCKWNHRDGCCHRRQKQGTTYLKNKINPDLFCKFEPEVYLFAWTGYSVSTTFFVRICNKILVSSEEPVFWTGSPKPNVFWLRQLFVWYRRIEVWLNSYILSKWKYNFT